MNTYYETKIEDLNKDKGVSIEILDFEIK